MTTSLPRRGAFAVAALAGLGAGALAIAVAVAWCCLGTSSVVDQRRSAVASRERDLAALAAERTTLAASAATDERASQGDAAALAQAEAAVAQVGQRLAQLAQEHVAAIAQINSGATAPVSVPVLAPPPALAPTAAAADLVAAKPAARPAGGGLASQAGDTVTVRNSRGELAGGFILDSGDQFVVISDAILLPVGTEAEIRLITPRGTALVIRQPVSHVDNETRVAVIEIAKRSRPSELVLSTAGDPAKSARLFAHVRTGSEGVHQILDGAVTGTVSVTVPSVLAAALPVRPVPGAKPAPAGAPQQVDHLRTSLPGTAGLSGSAVCDAQGHCLGMLRVGLSELGTTSALLPARAIQAALVRRYRRWGN